jgi:hypothetical protein
VNDAAIVRMVENALKRSRDPDGLRAAIIKACKKKRGRPVGSVKHADDPILNRIQTYVLSGFKRGAAVTEATGARCRETEYNRLNQASSAREEEFVKAIAAAFDLLKSAIPEGDPLAGLPEPILDMDELMKQRP